MEIIPLSDNSKRLTEVFYDFYKNNRVFTQDHRVQRDPELQDFLDTFALSVALDLRAYATEKGRGLEPESKMRVERTLFFNAKMLVAACDVCCCYYGVWDGDTGECYDVGTACSWNCA